MRRYELRSKRLASAPICTRAATAACWCSAWFMPSMPGVLFTRDPAAGGLAMVEVVEGTAENLVSGNVRPQTCRFGRVSKKPFGKARAPIDLLPLLAPRRQSRAAVRRAARHRMGVSRWTFPSRAEPRHHAQDRGRCRHCRGPGRLRARDRTGQGRGVRRNCLWQERTVGDAAAADAAVAVADGIALGERRQHRSCRAPAAACPIGSRRGRPC